MITLIWYLPCLFVARMGMEAVNWTAWRFRMNGTLFALALVVPAFAVGFLLPRPEIGYPWGFNTAFIALGFILLGFVAKGRGGAYAEFRDLLLRTRSDGVITEAESAEIDAALKKLV